MGLNLALARALIERRTMVAPTPAATGRWLSIGTVDYWLTYPQASLLGLGDPELHQRSAAAPQDNVLHKALMAGFARALGYAQYAELDVNGRADVQWDLNYPVDEALVEGADFVYDAGSIEHVMNAWQALSNVLSITKIGGIIVHSQGVGDEMDHGYWTMSPSLIVDFYEANGCTVEDLFFVDRDGVTFPYRRNASKGRGLFAILPAALQRKELCRLCYRHVLKTVTSGRLKAVLLRALHFFGGAGVDTMPGWGMIAIIRKHDRVMNRPSDVIQTCYRSTVSPGTARYPWNE